MPPCHRAEYNTVVSLSMRVIQNKSTKFKKNLKASLSSLAKREV